jgi:hypothetical protein
MADFLSELAKSNIRVDMIGCVNSGINLTTKGSKVLPSLKTLEKKGAIIATCITCLEFHKKEDDLLIGKTGTMDQTVQILAQANKVIRPN